jgi:hypothetical protein
MVRQHKSLPRCEQKELDLVFGVWVTLEEECVE